MIEEDERGQRLKGHRAPPPTTDIDGRNIIAGVDAVGVGALLLADGEKAGAPTALLPRRAIEMVVEWRGGRMRGRGEEARGR
mgnify:CR=1 FL=1